MESVAALPWNQWQRSCGTGGSFAVESVAGFTWNRWQFWRGIRMLAAGLSQAVSNPLLGTWTSAECHGSTSIFEPGKQTVLATDVLSGKPSRSSVTGSVSLTPSCRRTQRLTSLPGLHQPHAPTPARARANKSVAEDSGAAAGWTVSHMVRSSGKPDS